MGSAHGRTFGRNASSIGSFQPNTSGSMTGKKTPSVGHRVKSASVSALSCGEWPHDQALQHVELLVELSELAGARLRVDDLNGLVHGTLICGHLRIRGVWACNVEVMHLRDESGTCPEPRACLHR